jgi:putative ABC transport system permease protein
MLWTNDRAHRDAQGVNSYPDYLSWTTANPDIASAAAFNIWAPILTEGNDPEPLVGSRVSADFFKVLGVSPMLGRGFRADEDVDNGPPVAVIAQSLWERRFHSDPAIIGKTISVNGFKYTVVGVMPASFRDPEPFWKHGQEIWRPLDLTAETQNRGGRYLRVIARLQPGVSVARAQRDLDVISERVARDFPTSNKDRGAFALTMQEQVVGESRPVLVAALGGALCLLLIVCGNVASLVLARHAVRAPEFALRTAIGADRGRLVRLLFTEVLVLAGAGCLLGLGVAAVASDVLRHLAPPDLPRLDEIHVDALVVAVTAVVSVLSAIAFGLAPAVRASRVDLAAALQNSGARATTRGAVRRAIVVGELAFCVVLLVSAGLLTKSALRLNAVPLGLVPNNLLTFQVQLVGARYKTDTAYHAFYVALADRLRTAPGVSAVALTSFLPLTGFNDTEVLMGGAAERPSKNGVGARLRAVTPGFFSILQTPVRGREFGTQDAARAPGVAIINQAAADQFYPGENPLGRRLMLSPDDTNPSIIVGVSRNVRFGGPARPVAPEVFKPVTQDLWQPADQVIVRGRDTDAGLLATVRKVVRSIDPMAPVSNVTPMRDIALRFSERQRFYAWVFGLFAIAALSLSAIGVYGVIAYSVTQGRREIAIRMALGARGHEVVRRFVAHAATLVVFGVAIGAGVAMLLGRAIASLLFDVQPRDLPTLLGASALLAVVGVAASAVPAIRAGRASPAAALRAEA